MKVKDAVEVLKERGLEAEWRDSDNATRSAEDLAESYVVQSSLSLRGGCLCLPNQTLDRTGRMR